MKKYISKRIIFEFLKKNSVMNLGTVDKRGWPYITPVFYIIDSHWTIYFVSREHTKKIKNIAQNKKVGLTVWDEKKMSINISGIAKEVKNSQKINDILDKIAHAPNEGFWPPILRLNHGKYVVYGITPKTITALPLTDGHVNEKKSPIEKITI